jgi:hypothetical protein
VIRELVSLVSTSRGSSAAKATASGGARITLPFPAFEPSGDPSHTCCPAVSHESPSRMRESARAVMLPTSNGSASYHATNRSATSSGSNPPQATRLRARHSAMSVSSVTVPAGFPHVPFASISLTSPY